MVALGCKLEDNVVDLVCEAKLFFCFGWRLGGASASLRLSLPFLTDAISLCQLVIARGLALTLLLRLAILLG